MNDRQKKLYFVTFLTFVRVPLIFLFLIGAIFHMKYRVQWLFMATFMSMMFSALTDLFDGYYARKYEVTTKLGAFADPLMDKMFYVVTLPTVVLVAMRNGHIRHAIFLLILTVLYLFRDQWVTFLRAIGTQYGADVRANWVGKIRTGMSFPVICGIYAFEESNPAFVNKWLLYTFEGLSFVLNLYSLIVYTHEYWPYLRKSLDVDKELGAKE